MIIISYQIRSQARAIDGHEAARFAGSKILQGGKGADITIPYR